MKRTERHHLKKNEFEVLTLQVMSLFSTKRREVTTILLVVALVGLCGAAYWAWHQHTEDKAHALLAEATGGATKTYPTERDRTQEAVKKYKVAADAYPSTDAGVYARYQEASLQ